MVIGRKSVGLCDPLFFGKHTKTPCFCCVVIAFPMFIWFMTVHRTFWVSFSSLRKIPVQCNRYQVLCRVFLLARRVGFLPFPLAVPVNRHKSVGGSGGRSHHGNYEFFIISKVFIFSSEMCCEYLYYFFRYLCMCPCSSNTCERTRADYRFCMPRTW